jgi:hypothetical protein
MPDFEYVRKSSPPCTRCVGQIFGADEFSLTDDRKCLSCKVTRVDNLQRREVAADIGAY